MTDHVTLIQACVIVQVAGPDQGVRYLVQAIDGALTVSITVSVKMVSVIGTMFYFSHYAFVLNRLFLVFCIKLKSWLLLDQLLLKY